MPRALSRNPGAAWLACALVACVWLDQGPSAQGYDALAADVASGGHPVLALWQPLAFAYRRAQDEELYYAAMSAVRGAPFDEGVLLRERGDASPAFGRFPEPDGSWHVPYRDVPLEYPALLLPFMAIPAWLAGSFPEFARLFGALMGGLLSAAVWLAVAARRGLSPESRAMRYGLAALLFLAQGGVLIQRLDAVPALFLAAALWAAARRRPWAMGLSVGLAGAAKILPLVVLLPMLAAGPALGRRAGPVARALAGAVSGMALGFVLPMLVLSPTGLRDLLAYHAARGLHVESTYGALVSLWGLATRHPVSATLSFGSYNLDTPFAWGLAGVATPLVVVSILALTLWLARLPSPEGDAETVERVALAGLAALLCVWLGGKVFSPQYMTWAIPFVVALDPRRRWGIGLALLLAMAIAQAYLRGFYDHVTDMRPLGVAALAARLGALAWMAVLVARAIAGPRGEPNLANGLANDSAGDGARS
jgi:hypothetical protein